MIKQAEQIGSKVDFFSREHKERALLRFIQNSATVSPAKMRDVLPPRQAYKELINLIQRIFLSGQATAQAVVFSAVEPGSGCTFICTRIAEILATQLEDPVCLVDTNFHSPGLEQGFEFDDATILSYDEEWSFTPARTSAASASATNLWLLSYRPVTGACPSLASAHRFQTLLSDLRKDFTYVIIDAAPLNEYADAAVFARMADGLVMVLEANDTRREPARKAKELLDGSGVPVLGAVLNKRTFPIPEPLYRRLA